MCPWAPDWLSKYFRIFSISRRYSYRHRGVKNTVNIATKWKPYAQILQGIWITSPDVLESRKKRREKISWHCPFKRIIHEIRWPIYDSRDLCISTSYSLKIAVITHLNLNFKETGDCKYGEEGRIFFLVPQYLFSNFSKRSIIALFEGSKKGFLAFALYG